MNRAQLEHVLRAAAKVTGVTDLIVIGSQAILASFPDYQLPEEATRSLEADLAVDQGLAGTEILIDAEELANVIDGALGEYSQFHRTFGYYAQGVEVETATLTPGWRERLVPVIVHSDDVSAVGWCLEPTDLWVSKAAAGRPKDIEFCNALAAYQLVDPNQCAHRIGHLTGADRSRAERILHRTFHLSPEPKDPLQDYLRRQADRRQRGPEPPELGL